MNSGYSKNKMGRIHARSLEIFEKGVFGTQNLGSEILQMQYLKTHFKTSIISLLAYYLELISHVYI